MVKKENSCERTELLSPGVSNFLKGIFALMVVFGHIQGRIDIFDASVIGTLLSPLGYLAVSGFFFLSAYGLYEQFRAKEGYMDHFARLKILPFYLFSVILILFYTLRDVVFSYGFSPKTFLLSFALGQTVVDFGWYLQVQVLIYLLFYVCFRFFPKRATALVTVGLSLYVLICVLLRMDATWYQTVFSFALGLFCAQKKDALKKMFSHRLRTALLFLVLLVLFLVAMYFGNKPILPKPLLIIVRGISALLFAFAALTFCQLLSLRFAPIEALGKRSLEIYVIQGFVFKVLLELSLGNDYVFILLSLVAILILAFLLHPLVRSFYRLFQIKQKTKG